MDKKIVGRKLHFMLMLTVAIVLVLGKTVVVKAEEIYEPLTIISGFNRDVIAENTPLKDYAESYYNFTGNDTANFFGTQSVVKTELESGNGNLYESDISKGFPDDGLVISQSPSLPGIKWQLAPYNQNNGLCIRGADDVPTSGTFNFSKLGCYQELYFLVIAAGGNGSMNVTVTYSDDTTSNQIFYFYDMSNSNNKKAYEFVKSSGGYMLGTSNNRFADACVMNVDNSKLIKSITMTKVNGGGLVILGVTGKVADIPAPTGENGTPIIVTDDKITTNSFELSWEEVSGAESYRVDVTTDENFCSFLPEYNNKTVSGTTLQVEGLDYNTTYYYRVRSVNSSGGQGVSSDVGSAKTKDLICQISPVVITRGDTGITLSIEVDQVEGYEYEYQWFRNASNDSTNGEKVGDGVTYTISGDNNVGTYYYYCVVKIIYSGETLITRNSNVAAVTIEAEPNTGGGDDSGNTPGGDTPAPSDSGEGGSDTPASDPVTPSGDEGNNGSQGTDGATGYVKDVTGTDEAAGNYSLSQKIVNNGDLKILLSLSDSEVNEGTKVWLDVADLGSNVSDTDKALIEGAKGDYTVGTYLDINLYKKVGNNDAVKVTKTNGNVEVSLVMPENLRKEGRTFGIVRVHDDMAALLSASYAGDSHALTFETDGFSTYAIVYKDGTATGGNTSSNTSTSTDNSSSGNNNTTTTTSTVVPKTDGMSGIMVWSLMLILSLSTLGVVAFMRVKEDR